MAKAPKKPGKNPVKTAPETPPDDAAPEVIYGGGLVRNLDIPDGPVPRPYGSMLKKPKKERER